MEALGPKLRRQRRRLGLTLDELSAKAGISKPYLSLIETGRVANPPSDQKLRRLEQTLQFRAGELITQAHLQRTPRDVRAVLAKLMTRKESNAAQPKCREVSLGHSAGQSNGKATGAAAALAVDLRESLPAASSAPRPSPLDLDDAYLSGVLAELVDQHRGNIEAMGLPAGNAVPVINKVQAGYPRDFTDLSYPRGVADDYVSCPGITDVDAFAARVHGDSMMPKYREGDIVIFSPASVPRSGDDCFVRFDDGQTTFKRVFFERDESGAELIRLQPRNERYRAQSVRRECVEGVYRAVFRYQRVDEG